MGLPSLVGKSKDKTFGFLIDRMWQQVTSWKNTFLIQAWKKILLQFVIQAIPMHTMSVFLLPKKLCKGIVAVMAKFQWSHKQKEREFLWQKWEYMGDSKGRGGLGFKRIEAFNKAMLARWPLRPYNTNISEMVRSLRQSQDLDRLSYGEALGQL